MEDLTLAHTKERIKLVEQKITGESISNDLINRAGQPVKGRETRDCYHCGKKRHLKTKRFKWLATDEGEKYAEDREKKDSTSRRQSRRT